MVRGFVSNPDIKGLHDLSTEIAQTSNPHCHFNLNRAIEQEKTVTPTAEVEAGLIEQAVRDYTNGLKCRMDEMMYLISNDYLSDGEAHELLTDAETLAINETGFGDFIDELDI